MVDLLKRSLAPLTGEAWEEIDRTAARVMKPQLTARTIVDFDGPKGWEFAAVNLGRLDVAAKPGPQDVPWGMRKVLPLVEVRVPFHLDQLELDNVSRGSEDADLAPLEDAARRIAFFEESAVYNGFDPGGIEGIIGRSSYQPVPLPKNSPDFPQAVARAVTALTTTGIEGPFALVLGTDAWAAVMQSGTGGYPPKKLIRDLIQGEILLSPALEGGVVLSRAEGYFELSVGQDFAVGYVSHDRDRVELFLTESFTFRVLEPAAAVRLQPA